MKLLLIGFLTLTSISASAEVECQSVYANNELNKATQEHINSFCDTAKPFSVSDVINISGGYSYTVATRVCCTKKP